MPLLNAEPAPDREVMEDIGESGKVQLSKRLAVIQDYINSRPSEDREDGQIGPPQLPDTRTSDSDEPQA